MDILSEYDEERHEALSKAYTAVESAWWMEYIKHGDVLLSGNGREKWADVWRQAVAEIIYKVEELKRDISDISEREAVEIDEN